ncbi:MAG: hypothetical protein JSS74_13010 [Actinobacteria bacterium]|nr:hypothetical protein [Actinomycetota bacterium]
MTMRIVAMSIVVLIGLSCLFVAIFLNVSAPPWLLFAAGVLFLVGAFGQLWQWGPLTFNARRAAHNENPRVWSLVRTGLITKRGAAEQLLRPGWVFVFCDRVEIFDVRYAMNPKSASRLVLRLLVPNIADISISCPTRLAYQHLLITLSDGRSLEIEITSKSGWSVRGARQGELNAVASAIRDLIA